MQLLHICAKREFQSQGEKKTKWYKSGILKITDRGKMYIRLFHQPMTDFYVFNNPDLSEPEGGGMHRGVHEGNHGYSTDDSGS